MQLTSSFAKYPHSRRVGSLLFLAGQGCRDPETNECAGLRRNPDRAIVDYDIVAQTRGVIANIERALAVHDLTLEHLVDVTVFLTTMDDFAAMNREWDKTFATMQAPTRTTVAVSKLPGDNFIEMKAIAAFPEKE